MEEDDFQTTTSAFLLWLAEQGVNISEKVAVHDFRKEGRGRGLVCVADLSEDEVLFSIPRKAVLNINTTLSAQPTTIQEAILAMPDWLALTTLLILEYRNNSKWAPYLAILPQTIDSLVFWSASELEQLQASTVVQKIGKEKADELFARHVTPLGLDCDNELLHKVASVIMAYAFDIPEDKPSEGTGADEEGDDLVSDDGHDEKAVLSMIPLADLLNADADRNNARLCCDGKDLEMRAIKPILKGEEIFNDYGQLPRSDLLRRYGYVTENYSPYDVAEIVTSSILSAFGPDGKILKMGDLNLAPLIAKDLARRVELAEREGIYEESYDLAYSGSEGPGIPDELLALLYILLVDEESLVQLENSSLPSRSKLQTELLGQVLISLLQSRISEYATSLEDDEKLLQQGALPSRYGAAIQVRAGEKKVLKASIQEASSFSASNKRMRGGSNAEQDSISKKRKGEQSSNGTKKGRFR